jgi:nucleotide-binding universal stress UspA family protein
MRFCSAKEEGMARTRPGPSAKIVVGVDGTASSIEALRWAARQAEMTGAKVEAVMAWRWPAPGIMPYPVDFNPEADATKTLKSVTDGVAAEYPRVRIQNVVVEGSPGTQLVRASEGADLLVLGSRGHGEIVGILLRSVGQDCVTQARCPVLIIRHGAPEMAHGHGKEVTLPAAVAASSSRL